MKFQGNIQVAKEGMLVLDIQTNRHFLPALEVGKSYDLNITEHKSQRSKNQNALMWRNIHLISKELTQDDNKTYCDLLERTDAKSEFIPVQHMEMERTLQLSFRGALFMRPVNINGQEWYLFKVYLGSSTMNTKQMAEVIEITKDIMSELGIYEV